MTEPYEVRSDPSSSLSADGARTHTDADPIDRIFSHGDIRACSDIFDNSRQDYPVCYDRSRDYIPH